MAADIEPCSVYQLPSGRYAMVLPLEGTHEVTAHLVSVKLMRPIPTTEMHLRASFIVKRAKLCWKAADWRRRVADLAAEQAEAAAKKERRELAQAEDISRARAIDAEHAAIKLANRRLLKLAA